MEPGGRYTCRKKKAVGGTVEETMREGADDVEQAEAKRVRRSGGGEEEFS